MFVPMDPTAQGFMLAESRNTPMHVGGLQLFTPPEGAGPEWGREQFEKSLKVTDIAPLYLKRPKRSVTTAGTWFWTEDDEFDLEYHVRHSALPAPGRVRELLELCGRLHGTRLALERPLWELTSSRGSPTAASRSTASSTTPSSTGSRRCACSRPPWTPTPP